MRNLADVGYDIEYDNINKSHIPTKLCALHIQCFSKYPLSLINLKPIDILLYIRPRHLNKFRKHYLLLDKYCMVVP